MKERLLDWLLTLYLALMEVVELLHDLSAVKPWVSWLLHYLLAIPCCYLGWGIYTLLLGLGVDVRRAYFISVATTVFLYRELEQILHRLRRGELLLPLDHTMDVVTPALAGANVGMKYLALLLCVGCSPTVLRHYDGLPPDAAAITYCDIRNTVRSALDANLFQVMADGSVQAVPVLAEILVHEWVHRQQIQRRADEGLCHKPLTWPQLLDMEVDAYCAAFPVGLRAGRDPEEIGSRYARALGRQFRAVPDAPIADRWAERCPQYALGTP